MANYLVIARGTFRSLNLGPEEIQKLSQKYFAWTDKVRAQGKLPGSNKLADNQGKVIHGGSKPVITDGPFGESKEVIGGYWMLEAANYEEALKLLADHPHSTFGILEVREVEELKRP